MRSLLFVALVIALLSWASLNTGPVLDQTVSHAVAKTRDERPSRRDENPKDTGRTESRLKRQLRRAAAEIDKFWQKRYPRLGGTYSSPRLRTFQSGVRSGCGHLASGVGPFYCSLDQTIYVDVPMIREVELFRDPFVMRTIFAHEWAHHIQYLSGYEATAYPDESGEVFNLQMELHADCLAGVWAKHQLDTEAATEEDLNNAMALAAAIGDPAGTSILAPDAHGSSEMRVEAFTLGLELGRPKSCEREILKLMW